MRRAKKPIPKYGKVCGFEVGKEYIWENKQRYIVITGDGPLESWCVYHYKAKVTSDYLAGGRIAVEITGMPLELPPDGFYYNYCVGETLRVYIEKLSICPPVSGSAYSKKLPVI